MNLSIVKLSPDYEFAPFDCNDKDLNEFLLTDAKPYQDQLLSTSYILEDNNSLVGFFCVSNDRLCQEDTNKWRKIKECVPYPKRRNSYPALRIGRLAIDHKYQGAGYGKKILDYIKIYFLENSPAGCRFLLVDAYLQSVGFYDKNGFDELPTDKPSNKTKLMYYDLHDIRKLMRFKRFF
ncbi:Acetyltransferase (GNAT) domain-containing protein [Dyadobacter soli]|uniref:Acetyltransferase (GNAT) domain-containing protein n=1 Tax=Dyadobacter soli TaxID=659014 RepID=A0A1G7PYA1_9BACT|nr:GNAT family N-acetyltransferase [Dyadobacter soli]SDF91188.1 Acetyltransferase (GNAT) domain-containing protein [Dyadobacter soli]